jgi:hypothetical protein
MHIDKFIAHNHALNEYIPRKKCWARKFLADKFNVYDVWDVLPRFWKYYYWDYIGPIIEPQNGRYRKVIPRKWVDVSSLIENVNFEFVKGFYEEEYVNGIVNWDAQPEHREFADWLEDTYKYITVERPILVEQMENAYPELPSVKDMFKPCEIDESGKVKMYQMVDDGLTYEEKYGEVNRIEKLIDDKDTEVLTGIVKRRDYFWT